jgi:hypothetical protein
MSNANGLNAGDNNVLVLAARKQQSGLLYFTVASNDIERLLQTAGKVAGGLHGKNTESLERILNPAERKILEALSSDPTRNGKVEVYTFSTGRNGAEVPELDGIYMHDLGLVSGFDEYKVKSREIVRLYFDAVFSRN